MQQSRLRTRQLMRKLSSSPHIVAFLEGKGLDPQFAMSCGVKAIDDVTIAYPLWNGQWKTRNVLTKGMMVVKLGIDEKPLPAVFGHMCQTKGTVFHVHLTEGETDALALSQVLRSEGLEGVAVAVPGVNGISHAVRLLTPLLGTGVHVTIYPDGDDAGNDLASAASQLGAYVVRLPRNQDLCEFLGSMESRHRWPALQLLRHHAATYVPAKGPVSPPKSTRRASGGNVPEGVLAYFQRLVAETIGEESIGYSNVEKVCCPWHADPNPSLSIDWDRCIWFCHGCGTGGGVKKWQELARGRWTM